MTVELLPPPDLEQTVEEAEAELRAQGVDVEGFLKRVRERRASASTVDRRTPTQKFLAMMAMASFADPIPAIMLPRGRDAVVPKTLSIPQASAVATPFTRAPEPARRTRSQETRRKKNKAERRARRKNRR